MKNNKFAAFDSKLGKVIIGISEILLFISVFSVILYIIFSNTNYSSVNNTLSNQRIFEIESGWERVLPDGTREEVNFPCTFPVEKGEEVVFENTLPMNVESHDYLGVRVLHQSLDIYIDGERRGGYLQDSDGIYRADYASSDTYLKIESSDSGKTIRLVFNNVKGKNHGYKPVYYGEQNAIVSNYLKINGSSFVVAIFFGVLGILTIIAGLILRVVSKGTICVDFLGWSLFLICLWDLTQSEFRDVLFANIKAISILPAICLLLFPVALALYFNQITKNRFRALFSVYSIIVFAFFAVRLVLQVNRVADFYQSLPIVFTLMYSLMFCMFVCMYIDRKRGLLGEYRTVFIGLVGMAVIGMGQLYVFIFHSGTPDGTFLCVGVCVFVLFSMIQAIKSVLHMKYEKEAAIRTANIKTQFLANMSHEIRTPINAVLGMNEAILRESHEENIIGYSSDVDHAGHLLLSLINDILDFSKLESGKMNLVSAEYNLRELLISSLNLNERKASDKNLKIELDIDENLPMYLCGDEVRIQQIINNLFSNSIKYTETGTVGMRVFGSNDGRNIDLNIHVFDTGMGIKEEDKGKLFSAFQRLDEKKNQKIEGTGLGLAITYQLVKLMNGDITIDSVYGEGSTFKVVIPQVITKIDKIGKITLENCSEHSAHKATHDLFKAPECKILVVDDVLVNLKVVQSLLRKTEICVDAVSTPAKCLELVKENKYDVILLDHMMPEKDGIEVFKEMKSFGDYINKDTPVIMLTANAIAGAKEEYLDVGFSDYISKPFSVLNLQTTLLKYIPAEKVTRLGE